MMQKWMLDASGTRRAVTSVHVFAAFLPSKRTFDVSGTRLSQALMSFVEMLETPVFTAFGSSHNILHGVARIKITKFFHKRI